MYALPSNTTAGEIDTENAGLGRPSGLGETRKRLASSAGALKTSCAPEMPTLDELSGVLSDQATSAESPSQAPDTPWAWADEVNW